MAAVCLTGQFYNSTLFPFLEILTSGFSTNRTSQRTSMCKSDKGKIVPVEAAMWGPELFLFAMRRSLLQNHSSLYGKHRMKKRTSWALCCGKLIQDFEEAGGEIRHFIRRLILGKAMARGEEALHSFKVMTLEPSSSGSSSWTVPHWRCHRRK